METYLQVLLLVAILILLAKVMGQLSDRFGLPLVLGELVAGVLLGPTLLNIWVLPPFAGGAHPENLRTVIRVLAELGVVVLMFLAGLETDIAMMRSTVKPAFWSACGGVVLPMIGGTVLSRAFGLNWSESIFIGTILTATSVTITAQTLMNMGELQSRPGSTILGAAVIDDVLGLMVLSLVVAMNTALSKGQSFNWLTVGSSVLQMVIFLALTFFFGPRLIARIFQQTAKNPDTHLSASVALALSFLFAFAAVYLGGMAAITGAYIAGLFAAMTPIRDVILENLRAICNSFFGPIFLVSIGLEINARSLGGQIYFFALACTVAFFGKIIGCGIGARLTGFGLRDSTIVGVGMIPRGEVGLITATIGWSSGVISQTMYMQIVVLVLLSTLITPPLLRLAFKKPGTPGLAAGATASGAGN